MLLDKNNTKINITCQQFECTEFKFIDKDRALVFEFRSRLKTEEVACKYCGSSSVEVHDNNTAYLKDLPIWVGIKQFVAVWYHRYKCKECDRVFSEDIGFKDPDARVTDRAANTVRALLALGLSVSSVAQYTGIHWDTIRKLQTVVMENALETRSRFLKEQGYKPKYLAVDEFAIHKGQIFATCVMDLELGDVLWVGKGRSAETFSRFFQDFSPDYLSEVKAVAMDMNAAFNLVVREYLPNADIVYDRYHVQSLFGKEVLSETRLDEARKHSGKMKELKETLSYTTDKADRSYFIHCKRDENRKRREIKSLRWSLLTNSKNLSEEQQSSLRKILDDHRDLATCYAMKEEMSRLFELREPEEARSGWTSWFEAAKESEIKALMKFAKTNKKRIEGFIAHATHPITTGKLEGLNNKIKVAKRIGYGYRNDDYFFILIRYISLPNNFMLIPRIS